VVHQRRLVAGLVPPEVIDALFPVCFTFYCYPW